MTKALEIEGAHASTVVKKYLDLSQLAAPKRSEI
jgi:hypothetical protein